MNVRPYLIGIAGGSASGKTSLSNKIQEALSVDCTVISTDCFYKDLTPSQLLEVAEYNFDHPDAFDFIEMNQALWKLLHCEEVNVPIYDYTRCRRSDSFIAAKPTQFVILEGIMALYDPKIRDMIDLKIFVHTDSDECLARRIIRDTEQRGRDIHSVIHQYRKFVKPAFDEFIFPMMKFSDIIVPRGAENKIAFDLIIQNLKIKKNSQDN
ncbi:unnamed protein product [Blepharisma stoltei]|uniref:Uridine kinase n=1 Tax=Blepharisma stoltei TaxID=1481888 RepID=A0AAU9K8E6_9CILI|nr:unnamed protein product [Blepharisma stoltei]